MLSLIRPVTFIVLPLCLGIAACSDEVPEQTREMTPDTTAETAVEPAPVPEPEGIEAVQERLAEERAAYEQDMADTIEQWQSRIEDQLAALEAQGETASLAARRELQAAWQRVEMTWDWFQGQGEATWHETRAALERDLAHLERIWQQQTQSPGQDTTTASED